MEWWLAYLLLGAVVGFFAGLLGIGGGLILVPMLTVIFTAQHFPPDRILHLALGTTMAAIIFTSASSLRAHHAHGAVNWQVVKHITPGIIIGTLGGATLVGMLPSRVLSMIFVLFIFYAATQMLLKIAPKPSRKLPDGLSMACVGGVVGAVSSFVAIGGGLLVIPFLTLCNVRLQQAIGTASAVGFPLAVAGAIGYIGNGHSSIRTVTTVQPGICLSTGVRLDRARQHAHRALGRQSDARHADGRPQDQFCSAAIPPWHKNADRPFLSTGRTAPARLPSLATAGNTHSDVGAINVTLWLEPRQFPVQLHDLSNDNEGWRSQSGGSG